MERTSYKYRASALMAAAGLALGCATDNWKWPEFQEEPVRRVRLVGFDEYNPEADGRVLEELPESFTKYLAHYGLADIKFLDKGLRESFLKEKQSLKSREKLLEGLMEDMEELGLGEETAGRLKPKQAVELSCILVSRKLKPDRSKGYELSRALDEGRADEMYMGKEEREAVCRHYAQATAAVFRALREINPGIRNTYLTIYYNSQKKHAYAQATTIDGDELVITFIDPSSYDIAGRGALNAVRKENFGEGMERLEEERQYLQRRMPEATITITTFSDASQSSYILSR